MAWQRGGRGGRGGGRILSAWLGSDALHAFSLKQARTLPSYNPMPSASSTGYHPMPSASSMRVRYLAITSCPQPGALAITPMPSAYWGKVHKAAHWGKVYKAADPTAHCTPYSLTPSQAADP